MNAPLLAGTSDTRGPAGTASAPGQHPGVAAFCPMALAGVAAPSGWPSLERTPPAGSIAGESRSSRGPAGKHSGRHGQPGIGTNQVISRVTMAW